MQAERPSIVKEPIKLPGDTEKLAFLLHNVMTEEECKALIKETEKQGYEAALVNIGMGRQLKMTEVRNSGRCIIDSETKASDLWQRIKKFIPAVFEQRRVLGLNERLRFLRYDPGEYFKPHFDGTYLRENGERSLITIQLYLNEGFQGGATNFLHGKTVVPVVPKTGSVLVFEHVILHEGEELRKGRKYSMRTDIMFSAERVK